MQIDTKVIIARAIIIISAWGLGYQGYTKTDRYLSTNTPETNMVVKHTIKGFTITHKD